MSLKGKRIAILAENLYQEMELWVPYYRMREEGAEVKVIGAEGDLAEALAGESAIGDDQLERQRRGLRAGSL
jgi:protease I